MNLLQVTLIFSVVMIPNTGTPHTLTIIPGSAFTSTGGNFTGGKLNSWIYSNILKDCVFPTGPGEMFGPRHQYLDLLAPIDESLEENATLLKLQSLLCSTYCDDLSRDTVAR